MFGNYRRALKTTLLTTPFVAMAVAGVSSSHIAAAATATTTNKVGIVCTKDATGGTNPTFNFETNTGYIDLPDGNTMFMWGYSEVGKPFQHPAPVLCVNEGDTVTINLQNTLPDAASIAFPGQTDVLADNIAAQPEFDSSGNVTSLTKSAAADPDGTGPSTGGSVSYKFVAGKPGTFLYESGTDPEKQVRMGLFGALIVRPTGLFAGGHDTSIPGHPYDFAYDYARPDSKYFADEEFLVLLSEIDPYQHQAAENNEPFDFTTYQPRYWLINGRGFPDSVADNFASWLPNQPYGALARIHEWNKDTHPLSGLARYLNVGSEDYPFHPHGNNGAVIGRDGEPLATPEGLDTSLEKFSINVGPGQAWDVLVRWYDAEQYSEANPVDVVIPAVNNQVFGQFYSGSPYLGKNGTLPPGLNTLNQCGEFYVIAHNHALYQITSWGVTMTGPITYMRIDPPTPNSCPN
jgi:FtsP/CotA-like multicopper oxidase with cupredoxin domain